mmetsp:Transcript_29386/g.68495  ORF Transcript_29386/g.68495 Transcript_29386/m.68495 type:complete len:135 (-) Transcript_29386:307-711(-)
MSRFVLLMAAVLLLSSSSNDGVSAFAPPTSVGRIHLARTIVLRMAEGETGETTSAATSEAEAAASKAVISADGTYYDDEVEPVAKAGISDSMRERLRREASTGLDPDQKQTNVLLYIMGAVGVLVILGGGGILY